MKYGQKTFRKSLFPHITVTSSHIFLRYGISSEQVLRVEAAKKNCVKNSEGRKINLKEKCCIQIVSNGITFNLYEMDFLFRTK